jgi:hypothetical protein
MEVQNILYACLNKMMLSALLMYFVLFLFHRLQDDGFAATRCR